MKMESENNIIDDLTDLEAAIEVIEGFANNNKKEAESAIDGFWKICLKWEWRRYEWPSPGCMIAAL